MIKTGWRMEDSTRFEEEMMWHETWEEWHSYHHHRKLAEVVKLAAKLLWPALIEHRRTLASLTLCTVLMIGVWEKEMRLREKESVHSPSPAIEVLLTVPSWIVLCAAHSAKAVQKTSCWSLLSRNSQAWKSTSTLCGRKARNSNISVAPYLLSLSRLRLTVHVCVPEYNMVYFEPLQLKR